MTASMAPDPAAKTSVQKRWGGLLHFSTALVIALFAAFYLYPCFSDGDLGPEITNLFIYAILAIALNVVLGYTGLLHLGIAAFFAAGAYIAGILTVPVFPFQVSFPVSLAAGTLGAGLFGILLGAPTLRLRGDYLALVTLGFGEVTRYLLLNLDSITNGSQSLNPIPPPGGHFTIPFSGQEFTIDWAENYRPFYYLSLVCMTVIYLLVRNLERSRWGRAWMAIREDELAATCMGVSATRAKISAFALSAALAGLAGVLYATKFTNTVGPNSYDFSVSVFVLCCVILGGIGSLPGSVVGAIILVGFDRIITPKIDDWIQASGVLPNVMAYLADRDYSNTFRQFAQRALTFSSWKSLIFGIVLIVMMRFRPEGLFPSRRLKAEMHN